VSELADVAGWWAYVIRYEAREMWRALPGPWWVKTLLLAACLAIPGPADEVALIAITAAFRRRRAARTRISSK
jgi:hypothetical protein